LGNERYFICVWFNLGTGFSDLEKYKSYKDDWKIAVDTLKVGAWDPAFHYDEDKNKLYLYWGSSNEWPLLGTEVKVKPSVRRFCKTDH
jgi:hypothetical protein